MVNTKRIPGTEVGDVLRAGYPEPAVGTTIQSPDMTLPLIRFTDGWKWCEQQTVVFTWAWITDPIASAVTVVEVPAAARHAAKSITPNARVARVMAGAR